MNAELTFLQFLQSLHSPMLDGSMGFITRLGDSGILWVTLTAALLVQLGETLETISVQRRRTRGGR